MADVVVDSGSTNPKELYGQGVRAYILQDYASAVSALGKASELLVTEHGDDIHESLGEVYLYYGKALLGLSREESEALGDAVPRNEDSSEEDDAEEMEENGGTVDNNTETNENNENEAMEAAANEHTNPTTESTEGTSNGVTKSGDDGTEATEKDEEPSDLQLAWEVLELAKKIFMKQGESAKRNLSETLITLGEVSLESENFESAVNDMNEGLKLQKDLFSNDSRTVAETYYKLGIAYSTNTQIEEAINNFNNSLEYLNNRITNLEKTEDKNDEIAEEIKEIKSLIPDIQEKVTDMKTYKDEALKNIVSAMNEGAKAPASSASTSKPATNISHLVKRKRKTEDTEDNATSLEEKPAKKVSQ